MKIWLLIDDQKDGPHHDFEVRSMINNKELKPDVLAWHEGMPEWLPVGEMPLFEETFSENEKPIEVQIEELGSNERETIQEGPPPLPDPSNKKAYLEALDAQKNPHSPRRTYTADGEPVESLYDGEIGVYLWRRLFARILDITVLSGLTMLGITIIGQQNPLNFLVSTNGHIFVIVLFACYDTLLLHLCGSTIGKSLLGLRTESVTGENLSLLRSLIRGAVAALVITAAGAPLLTILIIVMCIMFAKLRKRLPWDLYAGSATRALQLTTTRVISAIIVFILINLLVSMCTPADIKEQQQETFTELFEKLKNQ